MAIDGAPEASERRSPLSPDSLRWEPAHDRASVEQFLEAYELARGRLLDAIDTARARAASARARASASASAAAVVDLQTLLEAARDRLAAVDRRYDVMIRSIEHEAAQEAARIVDAARADASRQSAMTHP